MTRLRRILAVAATVAAVLAGSAACKPIGSATANATTSAGAPSQAATGRLFGVASDPWAVRTWAQQMSVMPTTILEFESWDRNRTIGTHFAQAVKDGLSSVIVTWEPWVPVSPDLGRIAQYKAQPKYSNKAIVAGSLDPYITRFAQSVAGAKGLTVYIRFGHEMNGDWYPWSHDPAEYAAAWRHIVDIFRAQHATNAKFVFSVHPQLYESDAAWMTNLKKYWPGAGYVDEVGATVINFGNEKSYPIAGFVPRLTELHTTFGEPVMLTEVNTAASGRVKWLSNLRTWVVGTPWVSGVIWSQSGVSRGALQLGNQVGDLNWDITNDMATRPVLLAMIKDLTSR